MRTELRLTAADWTRSRFVRSQLFETMQAVRTLVEPVQQQFHQTWLNTIDRAAAERRCPTLIALNPHRGWVPDFLAPPPAPSHRHIDLELAEVARHPAPSVADELRRSLRSSPSPGRRRVLAPLIEHPERALDQIVSELSWAWTQLMAPFWPRVAGLIDADIAYRAERIAHGGIEAALVGLHRSVSWTSTSVTLDHAEDLVVELAGRGLSLMPSAFVWPMAMVVREAGWPPTLVYPARGIGELWSPARDTPPGLVAALGRTRGLLLSALDQPATTTTLALRHDLSMAATSAQLTRLRDARLILGRRRGKEVHYRRTALGDALVRANRLSPDRPSEATAR